MKKSTIHIIMMSILFWTGSLLSCDRIPEQALQQAGDNRAEMEKVLAHFKDDPDPLKYRAAKFLIENMPYNFTYEGAAVEAYDSAYLQMADEPLPERNRFFKERTDSIRFSDKRFAVDIQTVKADYLIHAIDEACDVPAEYADKRIAYICVFDNRNWVPVFYGNIRNGKVTFTSMGRNIVYMAAFYEHGQIVPFGEPFLIKGDGTVRTIQYDDKKRTTLKLLRKYPFMGKEDFFNARMSGGRFQGANLPDFSDAKTFYTFEGLTNGNWYEIPVTDKGAYRYLRYIGPTGSHCNINELEFYGIDGKKLLGTIIGTEGDPWASKETVFDGDILTGFSGVSPDGHWVGLKLPAPQQISKFKFIPRNDGNGVEIGDEYELVYWKDGNWSLLGTQVATHNVLTFKNVPSGGLYVLRDKTKGHEQRIFTYEKGEQVWW